MPGRLMSEDPKPLKGEAMGRNEGSSGAPPTPIAAFDVEAEGDYQDGAGINNDGDAGEENPSDSGAGDESVTLSRRKMALESLGLAARGGRHGFQTKAALLFASVSVVALAGLSGWTHLGRGFCYGAVDNFYSPGGSSVGGAWPLGAGRYLDDNDNNGGGGGDGDDNNDGDWSGYSCDGIFVLTEPGSSDRCSYAQTCNGGDGLYISFVFCNDVMSTYQWCLLLSPLLLIWLVTLFRMLGTTAEDYFSPSLEMFSLKMGLPPRFAGVTLLALGNGAADVSATVSAFVMDPEKGYQMSLGALTGAGMFVGTVVAGMVIVTAEGVPCRGALVRDVVVFLITTVVVYFILKGGSVGPGAVTTFFTMYAAFVAIVLIADIYHRAVVLPRLAQMAERRERERQEEEGRRAQEAMGEALDAEAAAASEQVGAAEVPGPEGPAAAAVGSGTLDAALAKEESTREMGTEMRLDMPAPLGRDQNAASASIRLMPGQPPDPNAVGSFDEDAAENVPIRNRALNRVLMALSNYDRYEERGMAEADPQHAAEGWGVNSATLEEGGDRPVVLHGRDGVLNRHQHHHRSEGEHAGDSAAGTGGAAYSGGPMGSNSPYSAMVDNIDALEGVCAEEGSLGFGAHSWRGAWHDGREELRVHREEVWEDIMHNEDNGMVDKFLLICELPFIIMRKLSVPIPCEGYYCRALVALSMAVSPLWIGTYFLVQYDVNLFWAGGFPYILVMLAVFCLFGALVMRYAPGGDTNMALFVSGPIAFYGFVVAATWIDAIADQLVGLLGFLGVILHIPGSVMGLTVLAWGNSMGDLSANMTMARKGLANMAITACFAGPVFNILIGLGGGFTALSGITGNQEKEVHLTPSIETGFFFLLCNCLLLLVSGVAINKGRVPAGYGYAALALYLVYVVASLVLQFSGFGGNG